MPVSQDTGIFICELKHHRSSAFFCRGAGYLYPCQHKKIPIFAAVTQHSSRGEIHETACCYYSAVTVISAADIRLNGWQTLADILNTLPGFSITNDYTYNYAAARGLAISGDWRSRMQILIHGISTNENIYHSE